jgi:hypothetical protein
MSRRYRCMKAILTIPPKLVADFSNRVSTRQHFFSQPLRQTAMVRLRYAARSGSARRTARSKNESRLVSVRSLATANSSRPRTGIHPGLLRKAPIP